MFHNLFTIRGYMKVTWTWTGRNALMVALYPTLITLPGTALFVYAQSEGNGFAILQFISRPKHYPPESEVQ